VILGVVNHEYSAVDYKVEIRVADKVIKSIDSIKLDHEGKYENPLSFSVKETGQKIKVEFLLYKKDETDRYRNLHLWVDVIK